MAQACKLCSWTGTRVGRHVHEQHSIPQKDYYDKYFDAPPWHYNGRTCLNCGEKVDFIDLSHGYHKFCSTNCSTIYWHRDPVFKAQAEVGLAKGRPQTLKRIQKESANFKTSHEGMTKYEWALWTNKRFQALEPKSQDNRFKYGYNEGPIMDFSVPVFQINIELDGWAHDKRFDQVRDKWLQDKGWTVLRFSNEQAKNNTDKVVDQIRDLVNVVAVVSL